MHKPGGLLLFAGFAGAGLLLGAMLFVSDPSSSRLFPPCPFHALTGWHCPGCGSLRAAHQLLHGDILSAFQLNPLMVLFLPFVAYGLFAGLWNTCFKSHIPVVRLEAHWIWAILSVIVLYGIARNLPFVPFSLLAP